MNENKWPLILLTLFWCSVTGAVDYWLVRSCYDDYRSHAFQPTKGVVDRSELREDTQDGDKVYVPKIEYHYTVASQRFASDRIHYSLSFGRDGAQGVVARYPKSKEITVYYNPLDPKESVLERAVSGFELYVTLFMTPFNLIGAMMIGACLGLFPDERTAAVKVWRSDKQIRYQLKPFWNLGDWLCYALTVTCVAILPTAIAVMCLPIWVGGLLGWIGALAMGWHKWIEVNEQRRLGVPDFVVDKVDRMVHFWPTHPHAPQKLPLDQIRAFTVQTDDEEEGPYKLILETTSSSQFPLAQWYTREVCQKAAETLHNELLLKAPASEVEPL